MQHERKIHPQTRLLIAGIVGLLIALLVAVRIGIPILSHLGELAQVPPLGRATMLLKLLSPLLSFVLAGGWVWGLLVLGERLLTARENRAHSTNSHPPQEEVLPGRIYTPEPSVIPKRADAAPFVSGGEKNIERRVIAAPPLFQLDPTTPWQRDHLPATPFPLTNAAWSPPEAEHQGEEKNIEKEDAEKEEATSETPTEAEQFLPSQEIAVPTPTEEPIVVPSPAEEPIVTAPFPVPAGSSQNFALQKPKEHAETQKPVTLTLLKQIRCWVQADDGTRVEVKLRGGENAIRLIQLAYIAWRRGASVDRDKLLTYVVARGKRHDMDTDQLGEVFDAAKRYLRQDVDRAIKDLAKNGHPIADEVDFFSNEPGFYWLHSSCQVTDLEQIEEHYRTIQMARKEGILDEKLSGDIPDWVREACKKLMAAYPGDFLQVVLEKFPEEFGAWVKEPVTLYRDRYLEALLILANHESALGKNVFQPTLSVEQNEEQRRHHIGSAAQLFYEYAMYALNNRWDQKLKFAYKAGKDGERVVRAARAMRRCVVELGKLGNADMIDQAYLAFKERMSILSEGNWKPDTDTESDVAEAKRTTSAYRFSSQMFMNQGEK